MLLHSEWVSPDQEWRCFPRMFKDEAQALWTRWTLLKLPLTTVLITTRTMGLDVGGLGAGVAYGGDTPHFSVVPRRLVLLGRTLLRVLVFGTLFSPHFGVQKQSLFSKETMLKPCFG